MLVPMRPEYIITVLDPLSKKLKIVARFQTPINLHAGKRAQVRFKAIHKDDESAMIWIRGENLER